MHLIKYIFLALILLLVAGFVFLTIVDVPIDQKTVRQPISTERIL